MKTLLAVLLCTACATTSPTPTAPQARRWTIIVDSVPSGASVLGLRAQPGGGQRFEALGVTPFASDWVQTSAKEVIKIQSGTQSVMVVPQPDEPILVDFTSTPVRVSGASQLGGAP